MCVWGGGRGGRARPSPEQNRTVGGDDRCVCVGGGGELDLSRKKTKQKVYMQLPYHLPYFERVQFS